MSNISYQIWMINSFVIVLLSIFQTAAWVPYGIGLGIVVVIVIIVRKIYKFFKERQKKPLKKFKKPKGATWIFFSYSTKDIKEFHIKQLAKALEEHDEFDQVLTWEEKTTDSIIEYMDYYIENADALVLFCSKNSKISEAVQNEWQSAEAIGIPIIPVFKDTDRVPALLRARIGVNFTNNPLHNTIIKLHENLLRKIAK